MERTQSVLYTDASGIADPVYYRLTDSGRALTATDLNGEIGSIGVMPEDLKQHSTIVLNRNATVITAADISNFFVTQYNRPAVWRGRSLDTRDTVFNTPDCSVRISGRSADGDYATNEDRDFSLSAAWDGEMPRNHQTCDLGGGLHEAVYTLDLTDYRDPDRPDCFSYRFAPDVAATLMGRTRGNRIKIYTYSVSFDCGFTITGVTVSDGKDAAGQPVTDSVLTVRAVFWFPKAGQPEYSLVTVKNGLSAGSSMFYPYGSTAIAVGRDMDDFRDVLWDMAEGKESAFANWSEDDRERLMQEVLTQPERRYFTRWNVEQGPLSFKNSFTPLENDGVLSYNAVTFTVPAVPEVTLSAEYSDTDSHLINSVYLRLKAPVPGESLESAEYITGRLTTDPAVPDPADPSAVDGSGRTGDDNTVHLEWETEEGINRGVIRYNTTYAVRAYVSPRMTEDAVYEFRYPLGMQDGTAAYGVPDGQAAEKAFFDLDPVTKNGVITYYCTTPQAKLLRTLQADDLYLPVGIEPEAVNAVLKTHGIVGIVTEDERITDAEVVWDSVTAEEIPGAGESFAVSGTAVLPEGIACGDEALLKTGVVIHIYGTDTIAPPGAEPGSGVYGENTAVTLYTDEEGAEILYSVSGSPDPDPEAFTRYETPILLVCDTDVRKTVYIHARAARDGLESMTATFRYELKPTGGPKEYLLTVLGGTAVSQGGNGSSVMLPEGIHVNIMPAEGLHFVRWEVREGPAGFPWAEGGEPTDRVCSFGMPAQDAVVAAVYDGADGDTRLITDIAMKVREPEIGDTSLPARDSGSDLTVAGAGADPSKASVSVPLTWDWEPDESQPADAGDTFVFTADFDIGQLSGTEGPAGNAAGDRVAATDRFSPSLTGRVNAETAAGVFVSDDLGTATIVHFYTMPVETCAVRYDANYGSLGEIPPQTVQLRSLGIGLTEKEPFRADGSRFLGWSTDPDAEEPEYVYDAEHPVTFRENITLYAVWAPYTLEIRWLDADNALNTRVPFDLTVDGEWTLTADPAQAAEVNGVGVQTLTVVRSADIMEHAFSVNGSDDAVVCFGAAGGVENLYAVDLRYHTGGGIMTLFSARVPAVEKVWDIDLEHLEHPEKVKMILQSDLRPAAVPLRDRLTAYLRDGSGVDYDALVGALETASGAGLSHLSPGDAADRVAEMFGDGRLTEEGLGADVTRLLAADTDDSVVNGRNWYGIDSRWLSEAGSWRASFGVRDRFASSVTVNPDGSLSVTWGSEISYRIREKAGRAPAEDGDDAVFTVPAYKDMTGTQREAHQTVYQVSYSGTGNAVTVTDTAVEEHRIVKQWLDADGAQLPEYVYAVLLRRHDPAYLKRARELYGVGVPEDTWQPEDRPLDGRGLTAASVLRDLDIELPFNAGMKIPLALDVLNEDNRWSASFRVRKFDEAGLRLEHEAAEFGSAFCRDVMRNFLGETIPDGVGPQGYTAVSVPETESPSSAVFTDLILNYRSDDSLHTVAGVKVWDDLDDLEGRRPDAVTLRIIENGEREVAQLEVLRSDNADTDGQGFWFWSFTDDAIDTETNTYTVTEDPVTYYTAAADAQDPLTVVNTFRKSASSDTVTVRIRKLWEGGAPASGSVNITLSRNGHDYGVFSLDADRNWETTVIGQPRLDGNGNPYIYSVYEYTVPDGYSAHYSAKQTDEGWLCTVTNVRESVPGKKYLQGRKTWSEDNAGQYGTRPDAVTVRLYADGAEADCFALDSTNQWCWGGWYDIKNAETGKDIVYTVREDALDVPGYIASYYTAGNNLLADNRLAAPPSGKDLTVRKVWRGGASADHVTVQLKRNGVDFEAPFTLDALNGWQRTFTGLEEKDFDGNPYVWSVTETDTPAGCLASYDTRVIGGRLTLTVFNTPVGPDSVRLRGRKIWKEAENAESVRHTPVTFLILADGEEVDRKYPGEGGVWTWEGVYPANNAACDEIVYTVWEIPVDGYISVYPEDALTVINVEQTAEMTYTVRYDANGGRLGEIAQENVQVIGTATKLTDGRPYRLDGADFLGWHTDPDAEEPLYVYDEERPPVFLEDITLYAVWAPYTVEVNWFDADDLRQTRGAFTAVVDGAQQTVRPSEAREKDGVGIQKLYFRKLPDAEEHTVSVAEEADGLIGFGVKDGVESLYSVSCYGSADMGHVTLWCVRRLNAEKRWETDLEQKERPRGVTAVLQNDVTPSYIDPSAGDTDDSVLDGVHWYGIRKLELNGANGWKGVFEPQQRFLGTVSLNPDGTRKVLWEREIRFRVREKAEGAPVENGGDAVFTVPAYTDLTGKHWPEHKTVYMAEYRENGDSVTVTNTAVEDHVIRKRWIVPEGAETPENVYVALLWQYDAGYLDAAKALVNVSAPKVWLPENSPISGSMVSVGDLLDSLNIKIPFAKSLTIPLAIAKLNGDNNWQASFRIRKFGRYGLRLKHEAAEFFSAVCQDVMGAFLGVSLPAGVSPQGFVSVSVPETGIPMTTKYLDLVINTLLPPGADEEHTVAGSKVWDDGENEDGIRPDAVTLVLWADGTDRLAEITVRAPEDGGDVWPWVYIDDAVDKEAHTYSVTEETVPEGYTARTDGLTGLSVTNVHAPDRTRYTDVRVRKVWEDDKTAHEDLTLTVLRNGEAFETVTVGEANGWETVLEDCPLPDGNGSRCRYSVSEDAVPAGYTVRYEITEDTQGNGWLCVVTNTAVPDGYIPLEGRKRWSDRDDLLRTRPESVTVHVLADGEEKDVYTLNEGNGWHWSGLYEEKNGAGENVVYTVWEETPENPDYTASYSGLDVTNTLPEPEPGSLTVVKVWNGEAAEDTVTVQLKRNGALYGDPVAFGAADGWRYEFTGLEMKDGEGTPYAWSVTEAPVPEGCSAEYGAVIAGGHLTLTVTNTPADTDGKKHISVRKDWIDAEGGPDRAHPSVTYWLLADGEAVEEIVLSEENGWAWEGWYPERNGAGDETVYTVWELPPEDYTPVYAPDRLSVTNVADPGRETYTVRYDANGGQLGRVEPETVQLKGIETALTEEEPYRLDGADFLGWHTDPSAAEPLYVYSETGNTVFSDDITLYAVWAPYVLEIRWLDADNARQTRGAFTAVADAAQQTVQPSEARELNGVGVQKLYFRNLPDAEEHTVSVAEEADGLIGFGEKDGVESLYSVTAESDGDSGVITLLIRRRLKAEKKWKIDLEHLEHPDSVTVILQSDVKPAGTSLTDRLIDYLTDADGADLDAVVAALEQETGVGLRHLNMEDLAGSIMHMAGTGQLTEEGITGAVGDLLAADTNDSTVDGVTWYGADKLRLSEACGWKDAFKLRDRFVGTVAPLPDGSLRAVWGKEIGYRVREKAGKAPVENGKDALFTVPAYTDGTGRQWDEHKTVYVATYEEKGDSTVITNLAVEDHYLHKFWVLLNGAEKPDSVFVALLWRYDAGYLDMANELLGMNLTQLWLPEVRPISGDKVSVNDILDALNIKIKIPFVGNVSLPLAIAKLNDENNWQATYRIKKFGEFGLRLEHEAAEFCSAVCQDVMKAFLGVSIPVGISLKGFVSVSVPEFVMPFTQDYMDWVVNIKGKLDFDPDHSVGGSKVWDDERNADGIRPDSVTLHLWENNDKEIAEITVGPSGDPLLDAAGVWYWEYDSAEIDTTRNTYSVTEDPVPGYETEIDPLTGLSVKNIHRTDRQTKVSVRVRKVWEGSLSSHADLELTVLRNGETYRKVTVGAGNGWQTVLEDCPRLDDNGNEYSYSVAEEHVPDGYTARYSVRRSGGEWILSVTDRAKDPDDKKIPLEGYKYWNDGNNARKTRPRGVTVRVLADGEEAARYELNAGNGWHWSGLFDEKNGNGERIAYTVEELPPQAPGYTASYSGLNVTNTQPEPDRNSLTVIKEWADGRPGGAVTVQLKRNGEAYGGLITLGAENGWRQNVPLPDGTDENGRPWVWTVTETPVPEGYTASYSAQLIGGRPVLTVTNRRTDHVINGMKEWLDRDGDENGVHPAVHLLILADGEVAEEKLLTEYTGWNWEAGLPEKDGKGRKIAYSVLELPVRDYDTDYSEDGLSVVNIARSDLTVTCTVINGETDRDFRYDICLTDAAGQPAQDTFRFTDPDGDETELRFRDGMASVYMKHGEQFTVHRIPGHWEYNVVEAENDDYRTWVVDPENTVETELSVAAANNVSPAGEFYPEYTHAVKKALVDSRADFYNEKYSDLHVRKVWNDRDNAQKMRPQSVRINLLADGEPRGYRDMTPDEDGNWSCVFENEPIFSNGKEIVYTVTEEKVPNYTAKVNGLTVTNTYHEPRNFRFTFYKVWDDRKPDHDRPDFILYNPDGTVRRDEDEPPERDPKDPWKFTYWLKDAEDYYVKEVPVKGYHTRYENPVETGYQDVRDRVYNKGKIINSPDPRTGDGSHPLLYALLAAAGAAGAALTLRRRKRRGERMKEKD